MKRTWQLYVWTGKKYEKPTSDGTIEARGFREAVRRFGLWDPMYTIIHSRKGYGHFTGMVEVFTPEAMAAREIGSVPADFVVRAVTA